MKKVCGVISFAFFFLMLGTVGAVEQDQVDLVPGMTIAFTLEALWALFSKLAGAFDPIPEERRNPREVHPEDPDARSSRTSREGPGPSGRVKSHY